MVPGRLVDDDCTVLLRFENGARGVLLASQIEVGELNGLRIRAYGDKGGLVWQQERPNTLTLHTLDGRTEIVHAGGPQLGPDAAAAPAPRPGIPEGYLEAFANIYRDFAAVLRGEPAPLLPGIDGWPARHGLYRHRRCSQPPPAGLGRADRLRGQTDMKTIKGPAIFLAQFAGQRGAVQQPRDDRRLGGGASATRASRSRAGRPACSIWPRPPKARPIATRSPGCWPTRASA